VIGVLVIVGAVLLTRGGGGETDTATTAPLPSASGVPLQPTDEDSEAVINLARESIEVLPRGEWPTLYNDFTDEFRGRCSPEAFAQAGVDSATNLGADLQLLAFKFLQDVTFTGDTANGTIVAEVTGKYEYQVTIAFQREGGAWKIAPVANATGCSAFNVLS
jgi:hypothetical protein